VSIEAGDDGSREERQASASVSFRPANTRLPDRQCRRSSWRSTIADGNGESHRDDFENRFMHVTSSCGWARRIEVDGHTAW